MQNRIEEQKAYYRARASEYDDWFERRGRYDHGPELNAEWALEAAIAREHLHRLGPVEHALELACGTGIWTQELTHMARRVTALDASAEMIAINRAKLGDARVDYEQVDLFTWQPAEPADLVFMGFWLSHVPTERLAGFLHTVRRAVKPGGHVFIIDSRPDSQSSARDSNIEVDAAHVQTRELGNGSTYRIVKVYYSEPYLTSVLLQAGFRPVVNTPGRFFICAQGAAL